ncbi:hypothetical protein BBO99_00005939 [Phytophthora kernoviae]|uniref:RING-type domain-containing protein n=1 Tax=Phytophthora kernoviae TaxID=325452 RepID=A0A3R7GVE7_9STRA|nr:hypothetical protein BBI17_006001 [Phytophthora kernoviae]RLN78481.1 hypothetical protein BBO99_00005939 [Phytophthora kernoviae]
MNLSALIPAPRIGGVDTTKKRRRCKTYSLKMLRQYLPQELPLLVHVSSATMEADHVVYNCTLTSVATNNTWSVSYRYSEFVNFRLKLEELWTCHDPKCTGSCLAVREYVSACFPKKRLAVMSMKPGTVADRKSKFENVLMHLLRCVLLPGSAMKCFHARQNLPSNLFEFLGVESDDDRRSLLQIFVDNYQVAMKEATESSLLESFHSNASTVDSAPDSTQCVVCLDDVDLDNDHADSEGAQNSPVVLPCKHVFHRECIFEWLLFEVHCPVCRVRVCSDAVTNYCRPKDHMNYGALVRPPQGHEVPLLTASAVKMLRVSVCQRLPLQFRVSSTTVQKNFVLYYCAVSSVTTNQSWDVAYRYSEFAAFIKKVKGQWTCGDGKCSGSCDAICEFIWICFPRKRLSILSRTERSIADRKRKFTTVILYLLRCILLPGSATKCLHLRQNLPRNLFDFLGVQNNADKRSLLQVFVDNYQCTSSISSELQLSGSFRSDTSTVDSVEPTQCTICLDDVVPETDGNIYRPSESSVIQLPCHHSFHRECIFEWILFQFHCPVCRTRVGPPAVASYCQVKNRIFQWWLSEFEEDPLRSNPKQQS